MNRKRRRVTDAEGYGSNKKAAIDSSSPASGYAIGEDAEIESTYTTPAMPNKTAAQLAFERQARKAEKEATAATATMTYRQRVDEYNKRLASLSEHHDIPKVGPG